MNLDFWTDQTSVLLTSFWGWSPETWGTLSFSSEGRRDNLAKSLSDPFTAVIYVTSNKSTIDRTMKNMVVGFYLVSHEKRIEIHLPIPFTTNATHRVGVMGSEPFARLLICQNTESASMTLILH